MESPAWGWGRHGHAQGSTEDFAPPEGQDTAPFHKSLLLKETRAISSSPRILKLISQKTQGKGTFPCNLLAKLKVQYIQGSDALSLYPREIQQGVCLTFTDLGK